MAATELQLWRDRRCLALVAGYTLLHLWWLWAVPTTPLAYPGLSGTHGLWEPGAWPRWLVYAWLLLGLGRPDSPGTLHPLAIPQGRLAPLRLACEVTTLTVAGAAVSAFLLPATFHVEHLAAAAGSGLAAGAGLLVLARLDFAVLGRLAWLVAVELAFLGTPGLGPWILFLAALVVLGLEERGGVRAC